MSVIARIIVAARDAYVFTRSNCHCPIDDRRAGEPTRRTISSVRFPRHSAPTDATRDRRDARRRDV